MDGKKLGADVIGHQDVLANLEAQVATPAHAYLFVGPENVGKSKVASEFAAALVGDASGRVTRRGHPDVVVDPGGGAGLGVDQVRSAVAAAMLRPVEAARKVLIFDGASNMTEAAANALLKTLEEPPPRTVIVLVAQSADDLPSTVASRCRAVRFGRVSSEEIAAALERTGILPERADLVARIAAGCPGLALMLSTSNEVGDFRRSWLGIPARLPDNPGEAFRLTEEMLAARDPLLQGIEASFRAQAEEMGSSTGRPTGSTAEEKRRRRRSAGLALLSSGLDMLASWYIDSVSVQLGGPTRNPDVPVADLLRVPARQAARSADLVIEAGFQLRRNQRPGLVLPWLFNRLAEGG